MQWNWGDTNPIFGFKINEMLEACCFEWLRYIPTRDLSSHLGCVPPLCSFPFKTYTGQPKRCKYFVVGRIGVDENISSGLWSLPSLGICRQQNEAWTSAYGHRLLVTAGFRCAACIIFALAPSKRSWMRLSSTPFWWCAPTPQNVMPCPRFITSSRNSFEAKMRLSAW